MYWMSRKVENNMYFYICEHCGANLDPGEKCDCQEYLEELDIQSLTADRKKLDAIVKRKKEKLFKNGKEDKKRSCA